MNKIFKNFTGFNSTVGLIASISSDLSNASVPTVELDTSVAIITKMASKIFKSKLALFFDLVTQFYKLLKLCINLQFKKRSISSKDSKYIRWIFGYYRSKYLRRFSCLSLKVTDFYLPASNNFFTVHGGGI